MQVAIVSGKGGTGKTSIIASLAALARGKAVFADCDVDAPDLHLILQPEILERREFYGIKRAFIDKEKCIQCGICQDSCRFGAIADFEVETPLCEGCGVCQLVCPEDAVDMRDVQAGEAYISQTRFGPMVHAELYPGEEASGKLVAGDGRIAGSRRAAPAPHAPVAETPAPGPPAGCWRRPAPASRPVAPRRCTSAAPGAPGRPA